MFKSEFYEVFPSLCLLLQFFPSLHPISGHMEGPRVGMEWRELPPLIQREFQHQQENNLSNPQVRIGELSPERICVALTISVPIPAVPTGSSLHPGRTRMEARQERISPQAGTAAPQSTPGHKKQGGNRNKIPAPKSFQHTGVAADISHPGSLHPSGTEHGASTAS